MAPHLVEYCMSEKCNASMRSTSASCVFTIIADYQGNLGYCLARNLIRDKVSPDIQEFVCPRKGISRKGDIKRFEEVLSLTALMVRSFDFFLTLRFVITQMPSTTHPLLNMIYKYVKGLCSCLFFSWISKNS